MPQTGIGEWLGGELAGVSAILQLVECPGRQSDAEGAVMVLTGFAVAGPVVRGGRDGEALASLAVRDPPPAERVLIEAHDADQIGRLLLDEDKPVFLGGLPEHRSAAVEIPGGAGVIAKAVGLVAPAPGIG